MSHGRRGGGPGEFGTAALPREGEQMAGIFAGGHTAREHGIVARLFAFAPQARARDPHERVEPDERQERLCGDLNEPVGPANVRELVTDDGVASG